MRLRAQTEAAGQRVTLGQNQVARVGLLGQFPAPSDILVDDHLRPHVRTRRCVHRHRRWGLLLRRRREDASEALVSEAADDAPATKRTGRGGRSGGGGGGRSMSANDQWSDPRGHGHASLMGGQWGEEGQGEEEAGLACQDT